MISRFSWRAVALALISIAARGAGDPPAFPGAEGFGSKTPGGRGGKVLLVTNLNDSGPGSLRAACETEGPRVVVFQVSGIIELKARLRVKAPFITIAGQTAPGDGVCLKNYALDIATTDVVVRFLRVRPGPAASKNDEQDGININHGSRRVVIDHCSANWSVDECLSLTGNVQDTDVQWCLIGEALNKSVHSKGAHGYGSLARANGNVSFHHNMWLDNIARNPRLGDNYGRGPTFPTFDVRNNIIYNYEGTCSGLTQGILKVNYVGNYIRPGPSSKAPKPITVGQPSDLQFFIRDNIWEGHDAETRDNSTFFDKVDDTTHKVKIMTEAFSAAPVSMVNVKDLLDTVLPRVGAYLPVRDAVDQRLVEQVRTRKGAIINSPDEVGGYPVYRAAKAPVDSDGDGMPDDWEKAHGLNPNDPGDAAKDRDGDGYTNIEEYVNSLIKIR